MIELRAATPGIVRAVAPPPAAPVPVRRPDPLQRARRLASRISREWAPLVAWHVGRTGRAGLVGIALLLGSVVFLCSTGLKMAQETAALRSDLARAAQQAHATPSVASESAETLRHLPARADMPRLLGVLLAQAKDARLTLDTAQYETSAASTGSITRYKVTFPVVGPYVQVRKFVDAVLTALPNVSIDELSIERKTIADPAVEARVRLSFFTRSSS